MPIKTTAPSIITAIVLMVMPTDATAQSRTFYGSDDRVSGRSVTGTNGATTYYGSDGRVTARTSTDSQGTTTIYGSDGRKAGTVTKSPANPAGVRHQGNGT